MLLKKPNVTTFKYVAICFLLVGLGSCVSSPNAKKKIIYINSYHKGFPPSDQITAGVMEHLPSDTFEVRSYFMDTKRNTSTSYIQQRVDELLDSIRKIQPDAIIASDDNAMKYLVVPHLRDISTPIVFCGVNWSVNQYDISNHNITGIIEILPIAALIRTIRPYYPEMEKLLVLNENTTTSRKTEPILDTLLGNIGLEVTQELVDDFAQWKEAFAGGNEAYDIIYLQTRGAISGWDAEEAIQHINRHIQIPVVTCEEFMMPYAVFGLTQLSEEQGIQAAQMVKRILNVTPPEEIPITRNRRSKVWLNPDLAERIGFEPDVELRSRAHTVE
jgi:ABC-type uncharacterized transport system substrate-binding protein